MADVIYQDTPVRVIVDGVAQALDDSHLAGVIVEQVGVENLVGPPGPAGETGPAGRDGAAGRDATLGDNAVGRVAHGASSSVTRPSGYALVIWIGSSEPANKATGDLWVRTA
ncbi:MAG TPA: hypothetical protein VLK58_22110 [Conexibacter sp.]|nr:hypothetical protein [Conexibacter sp.]